MGGEISENYHRISCTASDVHDWFVLLEDTKLSTGSVHECLVAESEPAILKTASSVCPSHPSRFYDSRR